MNPSSGTDPAAAQRIVSDARRRREQTAAPRCACYAAWSELLASPHDIDVPAALRQRQGIAASLDYAAALDRLIGACLAAGPAQLKREYSGLFEIGNDGPPVPIREDLQTGQRAGTREDLVRFYDYFGYTLGDGFAWQPDHLSVELEFMHYLCYREAAAAADPQSYQLAQADFTDRHLLNWVPRLATTVRRIASRSLYADIVAGLAEFLEADRDWQAASIEPAGAGIPD
ncbi:MAG: hypothetical protein D6727_06705 [Gammaproteobacteria bacterium]|nr:MAG: hypothetical protein D6727_06705 [Gammaproteobacteria bacterium]